MTPTEEARLRDVVARIAMLEKENVRLRALLKASYTKTRKAVDEGRRLHGILLMNGIEVK